MPHPTSFVLTDLDGDGDVDAAVTDVAAPQQPHLSTDAISIMLNDGDGVFRHAGIFQGGGEPVMVVSADFDGDCDPDLATANARTNDVSILFNDGRAVFAPPVSYPVGTRPRALKAADLDGDGDIDLAVLNIDSRDVSALLNDGQGGFTESSRFSVGYVPPQWFTGAYPGPYFDAADLDGDRAIDLILPTDLKEFKVCWNRGGAIFDPPVRYPACVDRNVYSVVASDFDRDGKPDLAFVAPESHKGLSVVMNLGGRAFAPPVMYDARPTSDSQGLVDFITLTAGDVNGDGFPDIGVGHDMYNKWVPVLLNQRDGTFGPKTRYPVHYLPWHVGFADVNRDGRTDLITVAAALRGVMRVSMGGGGGQFATHHATPPPRGVGNGTFPWITPSALAGADLDGNGTPDLAVAIQTSGTTPGAVITLLGDGRGAFPDIIPYILGTRGESSIQGLTLGDLNGDRAPDIVAVDAVEPGGFQREGAVWVLLNRGDGRYGAPTRYPTRGVFPKHAVCADMDGDRDVDVAVWACDVYPGNDTTPVARSVLLMLNDGLGVLADPVVYEIDRYPWPSPHGSLTIADMNGDAAPDVLATATTFDQIGSVGLFFNDGHGRLAPPVIHRVPWPFGVAAGDIDGDGDRDALIFRAGITRHPEFETIIALINDGRGNLTPGWRFTDHLISMSSPAGPTLHDVDGDRVLDALLPNEYGAVCVFLGRRNGTFAAPIWYGCGAVPTGVVAADFDGNGQTDLATSNFWDNNTSLTLAVRCNPPFNCYADCDPSTGPGILDIFDFLCFQNRYEQSTPYACDCDTTTGPGLCDIFDFLCFQNAFAAGCP